MNTEEILKEILEQLKEINTKLSPTIYRSTTNSTMTVEDFQAATNL